MPFPSGTRLGAYEITHVLGAGGMGQVYRARDSRLGRDVAIKVILESLASDVERVARFEREAKALAAMNHPNIAVLFGLEEAAGQHFLVMELVEGETLAERLKRGPLEIEDALAIARQITEALEAAHDKNIVHRDLKPANIKITPDDKVKVLDFGLAKAMQADPDRDIANSPTLSIATNVGIILGTAAYMSPEQAKGLAADHRSDVFSFGVVLFEMLTGRQPFQGETAADVLASVLVREPELQRLPSDLNPRITELLRRCLEKHPRRRWQAIGDLRAEIEAVAAAPRAAIAPASPAAVGTLSWRRAIPVAAAAVLAAGLGAMAAWQLKPAPVREVTRFTMALHDGQSLTGVLRRTLDISPDGRRIVFSAGGQLHERLMSSASANPIQATANYQNAYSPVFSPDGEHVAFFATSDRTIKRAALTGGAATTVCEVPSSPVWMSWFGDFILFTQGDAVMRVSAGGGNPPEKLVSVGAQERVQRFQMLPGGETVLLTVGLAEESDTIRTNTAQILAHSLKSGTRKILVRGASDGWYVPTGHLMYAIGGILYADEFDLRKLEVKGRAVPIVEGVRRAGFSGGGIAWFSISNTGTLVYAPGSATLVDVGADIGLVDRKGSALLSTSPLKLPPAPYQNPRASADGKRIVVERNDGNEIVILIYDLLGTRSLRRLPAAGRNRYPIWNGDGSRIVFQSDGGGDRGIFSQAADGAGAPERLTTAAPDESHIPESWQPRGDVMLYAKLKGSEYSLWTYSARDRTSTPFGTVRSAVPIDAVFSPNGKWVAYTSASSPNDLATVHVEPFPPTGRRYQIERTLSSDAPHHAVWSEDGTELIFNQRAGLLSIVEVTTSPAFTFGNPRNVPRRFVTGPPSMRRAFDVLPDGRLVAIISAGADGGVSDDTQINVVMNWFEELRARVSAKP